VIAKKSADGFTQNTLSLESDFRRGVELEEISSLPSVNYGSPSQVEWPATFVPREGSFTHILHS